MYSKTAVVILNWNGRDFLERFLPSVVKHSSHPDIAIWVIDNGSDDDSVSFVRSCFPMVNILKLDQNYGFTGGYNRGLKSIEARYYILLNSDIEVTDNWIIPIIEQFELNPKLAAAAPKLLSYSNRNCFEYAGAAGGFIDYLGYPFCRGRIIAELEQDKGQYDNDISVFWASGACMFIRADIFHNLGGFDDNFFAHMEEIDLCWRIKNAGYQIYNFSSAHVYHLGGGTLPNNTPFKIYLNYRNNLLLLYKNVSKKQLVIILALRLCLDFASAVIFLLQGKSKFSLAVFKAYKSFMVLRKKSTVNRFGIKQHAEILKQSIVFQYFVHRKRKFSDY